MSVWRGNGWMHSRPDRLTNNCLDIALPFLAFPYLATAPIYYGHLLLTDRLAANHQPTDRLQGASRKPCD
jgi:hypothetical protein